MIALPGQRSSVQTRFAVRTRLSAQMPTDPYARIAGSVAYADRSAHALESAEAVRHGRRRVAEREPLPDTCRRRSGARCLSSACGVYASGYRAAGVHDLVRPWLR
jgi:hypothetical protein